MLNFLRVEGSGVNPSLHARHSRRNTRSLITNLRDSVARLLSPTRRRHFSMASLIDFAKDGKRVYVCMRANSTSEAIEKWRRLVGDSKRATESLKLVINERVLRRLCLACKEGFTPDPSTLKKFNMSPDKVTTLYKAREQTLRDKKGQPVTCQFCLELRYKGRMGVFELMVVDDEIRAALDSNRPLAQAFRKQRGRLLQEEL